MPALRQSDVFDTETVLPQGLATAADVLAFLRRQDFTAHFPDADLQLLASHLAARIYTPGELILREGEQPDTLFFVYRGAVEVLKHHPSGRPVPISRLEAGAVFGEMSFIDREPASASIRAADRCVVLFISRKRLDRLANATARNLHLNLTTAVAVAVIRRLRDLSTTHVQTLQRELDQVRLRSEFARFFIITLILFGIASLVQKLVVTGLPPALHMVYSWGFLLLTLAPIVWFTRRQGQALATFGLTLHRARASLLEALGWSVGLAVVASVWRLATREPGDAFLTWGSIATYSRTEFALFFLLYGPHCFLQEFIGRGVIQGSLARFFTTSRPIVAILVTSALFAIFHFHVSMSFAVVTFAVSVAFGLFYSRHGTLVGVTALHYALGLISVAVGLN